MSLIACEINHEINRVYPFRGFMSQKRFLQALVITSLSIASHFSVAQETKEKVSPTPWEDPSCQTSKTDLKLSVRQLAQEYVKQDMNGEFLAKSKWLDEATVCPGRAKVSDAIKIVKGASVRPGIRESYAIRYNVVGSLSGNAFFSEPSEKTVIMNFIKTPYGTKLVDTFLEGGPYVSIEAAKKHIAKLKLETKKSQELKKLQKSEAQLKSL